MTTRTITLALILFGPASLSAQLLFTDSLASDNSKWTVSPANQGGGSLNYITTPVNALGYTVGTPVQQNATNTANDTGFRSLTTFQAPGGSSWTAQVDIHLANFSGLTQAQFINLNLIVAKASDWNNYSTSLALDRYYGGPSNPVVQGIDTFVNTNGTKSHLTEILNPTTDATLAISYDAVNQQLIYAFDSDGALGGYNFIYAHSVNISPWNMSGSENFGLSLVGGSGSMMTNLYGPVVNSTDAYFRNYSVTAGVVSAVPEPATYAAIFGLTVLSFVAYRRRRKIA